MFSSNKNVGGGNEADYLCYDKSTTYKVPTAMTLTLYNQDGSLRADSLEVDITSAEIAKSQWQCGKLGAVAEVVLGIIPEFGKFISDQVSYDQLVDIVIGANVASCPGQDRLQKLDPLDSLGTHVQYI